jgi:hypothetical protein
MEETDVCYLTPTFLSLQQAIPNGCAAKALLPSQRSTLAVHALGGNQTITELANQFDVSRKFVYQQAAKAQAALDDAFTAATADDEQVLFHLPVTKAWLEQVVFGLTLICHSSYRGAMEFSRDLLGVHLSLGTVHNIMRAAVEKARPINQGQNLANIEVAGLDEIFQNGRPVLVGADIRSTYCFLLSHEEHRDADTWGIRLLELQERGFAPRSTVADFGTGIRAGQKLAMPGTPCGGDVFHALQELHSSVHFLEERAYAALTAYDRLQHQRAKAEYRGQRTGSWGQRVRQARVTMTQAMTLADDVALLVDWLHHDVFAVSALPYADRCTLFDFILAQLQTRQTLCPHRLDPLCSLLKNHRTELLAFANQLDRDLHQLAAKFEVPLTAVRELFDLLDMDQRQPRRWQKEVALRQRLRKRFRPLRQALGHLRQRVIRASSIIENINSRSRKYFFLRQQLGSDYLVLLRFFLNHRRFPCSDHPERRGKSPAELLTGQTHPHWLEMLGYTRFPRN